MNKQNLRKKNKEGIANILLFVSVCLLIAGVIIGISNIERNWDTAFLMCLCGTLLSYISGYLKTGYIKFFN